MPRQYVIGTRGSQLALWQANYVKEHLRTYFPENSFEIKIIKTVGDELLDIPLSEIGDKGLFTKQIETQLASGNIDFAVHSLKDLQTVQPNGLIIAAVSQREMPNDALISKEGVSIDQLQSGARVATGSLRRRSQLLHYRPDLEVVEIRGNVPTRLENFHGSDLDAILLAYAGLRRLGLEGEITQIVPSQIMLPAVGQGALAIEANAADEEAMDLARSLDDEVTRICITAERAFLRRLEGGCQVPIGALATLDDNGEVTLEGMVGSLNGEIIFRQTATSQASEAGDLGTRLAEDLIDKGAASLLADVREAADLSGEKLQ